MTQESSQDGRKAYYSNEASQLADELNEYLEMVNKNDYYKVAHPKNDPISTVRKSCNVHGLQMPNYDRSKT